MTDEAKRCVEALRFKEDFECIECPIPAGNCEENCMLDVAADLIESLSAELEQVKLERDAAVEDFKDRCYTGKAMCYYCTFLGEDQFCTKECDDGECFEWRGVKEDSK